MFFCKQKTAYDMRMSDWRSDVCSSDLAETVHDDLDVVGQDVGDFRGGRVRQRIQLRADQSRVDLAAQAHAAVRGQARAQAGPGPAQQREDAHGRRKDRCLGTEAPGLAGQVAAERRHRPRLDQRDRKSVVEGKSVSVGVDTGGWRFIKKKKKTKNKTETK